MIRQAVTTSPTQAFLIAITAAVGAAAILQAPQVAPRLTAVADAAVELMAAGVPVDLGTAAMDAGFGQQQLPEALDGASLDSMAVAPSVVDDDGTGLSSAFADLVHQVADPAAWVVPAAQGGLIGGLFEIVQDVVQFVWNVITFPLRVVEQVIGDVLGLL